MLRDVSAIDVRYVKGVGPAKAKILNKLGIKSVEDILYYFPRRYEDRPVIDFISQVRLGECQALRAGIVRAYERVSSKPSRLRIFEALVEDKTGRVSCVWFNQPFLRNYLKAGQELALYGRIELYGKTLQMQNPEYEIINAEANKDSLNYGRIVPVYPLAENISQKMFRRLAKSCLDEYLPCLADILPYDIRQRHNLLNVAGSILNMHFPASASLQGLAYKRILFEECFLLQLIFGLKRLKSDKLPGISHSLNESFLAEFERGLPFKMTSAQRKVIQEIKADMASPHPMHRMLQGDVGSGKTVVAWHACMVAVSNGYQAAFMAPTELLAQQHYQNISRQLSAFSCPGRSLKAGLLTSSLNKPAKQKVYENIKNGKIDILIGTHALIQEGLEFKALSLAVIDEQHKFGVHQRLGLLTKSRNPDCLIMTATPIPRTLAMVIYSDLDMSILDESPAGRIPVKTYLVKEDRRQWMYDLVKEFLKSGRQAYIVYPIIEESQKTDLKSASLMYEDLSRNVFKEFKLGLIHGRIKPKQRNAIMQSFKEGKIDLLVSTVVIEVGIDVANASVMVIEHADRFGLSQLHQLRGRIGRGAYESHCILISDAPSQESLSRLQVMVEERDGFKIAQRDLELRGPGEFFGVRQHGLPELRVNPLEDLAQLNASRQEALKLLALDPELCLRQNQALSGVLRNRFPGYQRLTEA